MPDRMCPCLNECRIVKSDEIATFESAGWKIARKYPPWDPHFPNEAIMIFMGVAPEKMPPLAPYKPQDTSDRPFGIPADVSSL